VLGGKEKHEFTLPSHRIIPHKGAPKGQNSPG
jgi:hypothetical protein